MHHQFSVSFFDVATLGVLMQLHTYAYIMCIISSFVTNWQSRRVQSRRHKNALVGFAPPGKGPRPPNLNMKQYKSVEILKYLQYQASLHKRKAPLVNTF